MATAAFYSEFIDFRGPVVPFELLKKTKISLGAKNVFALIAAFRRSRRRCFARPKWFAEQMGVSESSARNYIKNLIEAGLIRKDDQGCYHVVWDVLVDSSTASPDESESDFCETEHRICGQKRKICGIYNNLNTKSKKPSSTPPKPLDSAPAARGVSFSSASEDAPRAVDASRKHQPGENQKQAEEAFAQVWAAYPRPPRFVSRERAWREFRKLWKQGVLPELRVILSVIELNRQHNPAWAQSNENGRYIPNLERWLAEKRWSGDFAGSPITSPPTAEQAALAAQAAAAEERAQTWGNASPEQIQKFKALEKRFGLADETKRSMAFGLFRFLTSRGASVPQSGPGDLLTLLKNSARQPGSGGCNHGLRETEAAGREKSRFDRRSEVRPANFKPGSQDA